MAITQCRECGDKVSTEAATCPHCGTPETTRQSEEVLDQELEDWVYERISRGWATPRVLDNLLARKIPRAIAVRYISAAADRLEATGKDRPYVPPPYTPRRKAAKGTPSTQAWSCVGCLVLILGTVLILTMFVMSSNSGSAGGGSEDRDRGNMAYFRCQDNVKARLRSPSTADFPFLDFQVTRRGTSAYVVTSYVDAQNAFGATIRSNFVCTIEYQSGDDADPRSWNLIDLTMVER